jgi:hypothetical protein
MCDAPDVLPKSEACAERPTGLAIGVMGGQWLAKDLPLFLSTFEYMVRGALLNWWQGMTGEIPTRPVSGELPTV